MKRRDSLTAAVILAAAISGGCTGEGGPFGESGLATSPGAGYGSIMEQQQKAAQAIAEQERKEKEYRERTGALYDGKVVVGTDSKEYAGTVREFVERTNAALQDREGNQVATLVLAKPGEKLEVRVIPSPDKNFYVNGNRLKLPADYDGCRASAALLEAARGGDYRKTAGLCEADGQEHKNPLDRVREYIRQILQR